MIAYCIILMSLQLLAVGISLGKNSEDVLIHVFGIFLLLPICGRIFGWW